MSARAFIILWLALITYVLVVVRVFDAVDVCDFVTEGVADVVRVLVSLPDSEVVASCVASSELVGSGDAGSTVAALLLVPVDELVSEEV
jgi:hypothetical protein